ncbi:MAG: FtsX-like permease family protein [Bacteroidetes bacterium]|nr:MAG: FtsX-like permease family protein [Bacteroidota bacterium]
MRLIWLLASRYLFSKKSNNIINLISWISLLAIAFTTAAFIIIISVMNGFTSVIGNLYNAAEPDLKVSLAFGKYFSADSVIPKLASIKEIRYISKSIYNQALLKYRQKQMLVSVKGVDSVFVKATEVTTLLQKGNFTLKDGKTSYLVLGQGIANELNVNITNLFSPLILYSPKRIKNTGTHTDVVNEKAAYVSGVFSINDDFDYKYVFCDLNFARDLFDAEGLVTNLEIAVQSPKEIENTQIKIQKILGKNFLVKNRQQLNEVLFKTLQTEKLWTFLILSFILLIATFSIISALTMLIIEKQKDIQTLYAMGADKPIIEGIFMAEGFLITFGGAFVGLLLGIIICWIQIQFHIITFNENSILPYYPVELQWQDILMVLVVLLVIGFFAAIYPVRFFTKEIKWNR